MEVSISAMCEHFRVPTCLVCCGFVISRDVRHLQLSTAEDDLVRFDPTAQSSIMVMVFQRTSGGIQTGLAWWVYLVPRMSYWMFRVK
jgi:hypothetical protein